MLHFLTYDLNRPGQDYDLLYRAIAESPCAKLTESCWLIRSNLTATQIRNALAQHIDHNDRLLVCQITDHAEKN